MYSYYFNPFGKPLENVIGEDLILLRSVSEGWYIEYKSGPIEIGATAKQLTAFANQYGGMLIYGIEADDGGDRKPTSFPGISADDASVLGLRLREAATTHSNPAVLYEEKIIGGPIQAIGLPTDRFVLIVGIPQGRNTPYVHSSGRIYRRLADKSEPREVTDRSVLDLLWQRGEENRKKFAKRVSNIPVQSKAEDGVPVLHMYIVPDPDLPAPSKSIGVDSFRKIVCDKNWKSPLYLLMNSTYIANDGYIAKHIQSKDAFTTSLTLRWWHTGMARFTIPLTYTSDLTLCELTPPYKYLSDFKLQLLRQGFSTVRFADFSLVLVVCLMLSSHIVRLAEIAGDERERRARLILQNAWRITPYLDSKNYIERVENFGIPVIEDETILLPEEPQFEHMFRCVEIENATEHSAGNEEKLMKHESVAASRYSHCLVKLLADVGAIEGTEDVFGVEEGIVGLHLFRKR